MHKPSFARLIVQHLSDPDLRAQLKADIKHDFAAKKARKTK